MSSALTDLCINLQISTDKLEEELKRNIADCHKLLIERKANETKLALEKAKDYHYKEVLDILKEIVSSIRKIIFHEEKIRKLNDESSVTSDELKRYSYVQRQVQAFSNNEEVVTKREKRRVASEVSLESLEDWEMYLDKKQEEELIPVETAPVHKRNKATNRKKKKFVSSTFNNFLDKTGAGTGSLNSIIEDEYTELSERLARVDTDSTYSENSNYESVIGDADGALSDQLGLSIESLTSIYESASEEWLNEQNERRNLSTLDILEAIKQENEFEAPAPPGDDTKPKIVEVIYKKKLTEGNWTK